MKKKSSECFDMSDSTYNYLGHFKQDKYLRQGHNDSGKMPLSPKDEPVSREAASSFEKGFNEASGSSAVESALKTFGFKQEAKKTSGSAKKPSRGEY